MLGYLGLFFMWMRLLGVLRERICTLTRFTDSVQGRIAVAWFEWGLTYGTGVVSIGKLCSLRCKVVGKQISVSVCFWLQPDHPNMLCHTPSWRCLPTPVFEAHIRGVLNPA